MAEIIISEQTNTVVVKENTDAKVIEVLKGRPGVQNVFVGDIPPENPEEEWIWIDTNG